MKLFGDFSVRLEPWEVEYGTELAFETAEETTEQEVVLDVESSAETWEPIQPSPTGLAKRLIFVDGVRRVEARIVVRQGEKLCRGAFGSYGVGSVKVTDGTATIEEVRTDRVVVVGSGEILPGTVTVMPGLTYRPVSTVSDEVDGPLHGVLEGMRSAEERLARELADDEETLVVADGPLTFGDPVRGGAVGYIKRLYKLYEVKTGFLTRLPAGARTPLFALRSSRRFARYAWFLRLVAPHPGESDLSGLVRLEVSEAVGVEVAKRLADATAHILPQFAPGRGRDPRAPQNLLPIGALESYLRRQLGDARLIRRHIESLLARQAALG
jgi:hypothetical protein